MVALKPVGLLVAFQDEEESLSEAEEHDAVDDGEGEHVPGDHLEDHGDKRPRQLDRSAEEHEIEPENRLKGNQETFIPTSCQGWQISAWILLCSGSIPLPPITGESYEKELS